jgi:hypothetical protein
MRFPFIVHLGCKDATTAFVAAHKDHTGHQRAGESDQRAKDARFARGGAPPGLPGTLDSFLSP